MGAQGKELRNRLREEIGFLATRAYVGINGANSLPARQVSLQKLNPSFMLLRHNESLEILLSCVDIESLADAIFVFSIFPLSGEGNPLSARVLIRIVVIQRNLLITKGDYSGISEQVDKEQLLGIAKEFSNDGMRWAHDKRTSDEIMSLVQLSKELCDRSDESISQRRSDIWKQNEGARIRMFEECD